MITDITKLPTGSLFKLCATEIVANLKTASLNVKTLEDLNLPKYLIYNTFEKLINEEFIFRDIQSRACIIKNCDYESAKDQEIIKNQVSKEGPAYLPNTSDNPELGLLTIKFESEFYWFINSKNFWHKNKYFHKHLSVKILEMHNNKIDKFSILEIMGLITAINDMEIYKNNHVEVMLNILEVVKLVETKRTTGNFMLSELSNKIYSLDKYNYNAFLNFYNEFLASLP